MGPINGGPINFSFTRLRHASLRFATLSGANLEMADLSGADLSDARLDGANLNGADLSEALLERADFARARLGGANLAGASLKDARNVTQSQIDEALGDALTILPAHLARPEGWGGAGSQVMSELETRNGRHKPEQNGRPAPTRGDTVSWLVGGPRSHGRTALPQAEPA
jgi:Pentapeptide repeats (8 copies)